MSDDYQPKLAKFQIGGWQRPWITGPNRILELQIVFDSLTLEDPVLPTRGVISGLDEPSEKKKKVTINDWLAIGRDIASHRDEVKQAGGYRLPPQLGGRWVPYQELESVLEPNV